MANINKVTLPDGTSYDIEDTTARGNGGVRVIEPEIIWNAAGTVGESYIDLSPSEIYDLLDSNVLVILKMMNDASESVYLYPHWNDTADFYFVSSIYDGIYYDVCIEAGSVTAECTFYKREVSFVPSGGTTGQVLTKTSSGCAWQSLPVYNGGVS